MFFGRRDGNREINEKLDEIHTGLSQINETLVAESKRPNYAEYISIISGVAGLVGLLGSSLDYINEVQYCRYWSIPLRYIERTGTDVIGMFFGMFGWAVILNGITYLLFDKTYDLCQALKEKSKSKKTVILKFIGLTALMFALYFGTLVLTQNVYGNISFLQNLIFSGFYSLSIIAGLYAVMLFPVKVKNEKNRKKSSYNDSLKFLIFAFFVILVITFGNNWYMTRSQTVFDIVQQGEKTYAALYLHGDNTIMKKCSMQGQTIIINLDRTYITSEPVEYETFVFPNVIRSFLGKQQHWYDNWTGNDMM